jgi:hypothetical protein
MLPSAYESEVVNLAVVVLRLMGNERDICVPKFNADLLLEMCQSEQHAQTDVCVMDRRHQIFLVVQEDEQACKPENMLPHRTACGRTYCCISNKNQCQEERGRELFSDNLMPQIIIRGTTPYLHKIKVTQDLTNSVKKGQRLAESTKIYRLTSVLPLGYDSGMIPLANRRAALQYYEL